MRRAGIIAWRWLRGRCVSCNAAHPGDCSCKPATWKTWRPSWRAFLHGRRRLVIRVVVDGVTKIDIRAEDAIKVAAALDGSARRVFSPSEYVLVEFLEVFD